CRNTTNRTPGPSTEPKLSSEWTSPSGRGSQAAMAGAADDVQLLLAGQVDELDRVAGHTDGEVGVLFLLGVLHGVDQLFLAKDIHVQMVRALAEVAVHDLDQVLDPLALAVAQRVGVDGLGVGDAVQRPV